MNVTVELVRAGRVDVREVDVTNGATIREVLRAVGLFAEGSAVLIDGRSVPLDQPLTGHERLEVVPTFSGG